MKTYKKKTITTVDEIYCDACGMCCTTTEPCLEHEYAELIATWGYFSRQDGTKYDIQLCESCFNDILLLLKNKRKNLYPLRSYSNDPLEGKNYI